MSHARFSRLWLLYFFVMIALVGGVFAYGMSVPLLLVGFFVPACRRWGNALLCRAIRLLMDLEPWFSGSVDIELPPRALTVSNHRSHLDTFILLSRIPGVRLVCKRSLFYVPGLAMMMRVMRQIPVRRNRTDSYLKAMDRVRWGLRRGDRVHVFPEMTRCEPGFPGTQPFHLAPFHVAFGEKVPVVPIAIVGSDGAWPKGRAGLSYRSPVVVRSLAPLDPDDFGSAGEMAAEARRRIDRFLAGHRA